MGDFCFGESFDSLNDPKKAELTETTLKGFRWLNAVGHIPGLYWLRIDALPSKAARALKGYEIYAASLADRRIDKIEKRASNGEQSSCVFDILHASTEKNGVEGFSLPELKSESSLLVTTGTDSVSGTLANVFFHLVNHPAIMQTLVKEIRAAFTDVTEIRMGKSLNNCKLLAACIDETMRLSSIVGGCLMREVGPGGIEVGEHLIPAGVDVGVPFHVIMRNPRYYDAPLEFRPNRWLPEETSLEKLRIARAAFCAFSIGPTGCVGKSWACVEMKLTLAQLLFQYDVEEDLDDAESHLSFTQRLVLRDQRSLDRFIITNKGPCLMFRLAKGI